MFIDFDLVMVELAAAQMRAQAEKKLLEGMRQSMTEEAYDAWAEKRRIDQLEERRVRALEDMARALERRR